MKTAVCISGQPRFLQIGFDHIKKNILDINDCDVFIHSWFSEQKISKWNNKFSGNVNIPGTDQKILKLYNPKKYIIEPQKENLAHRDYAYYKKNKRSDAPVHIQFSMLYSIKKANELKRQYETEQKIKYDCVLRLRFDSGILTPVDLSKHEMNCIYYANAIRNPKVICDWFDFGSSDMMNIFSNTYDEIDNYYHQNVLMCGEELITKHLKTNKIKYAPLPISLFLVRDQKFTKGHYGKFWK